MAHQAVVLKFDSSLARRVRTFLASRSDSYESFDEFVAVALENQLRIEGATGLNRKPLPDLEPDANTSVAAAEIRRFTALLQRPSVSSPCELGDEGDRSGTLSVFTNRLSPIKVAARVLANMSVADGQWPEISRFREDSAATARYLGRVIQGRDENTASGRRWVAYPVGNDAEKAKTRFANSFTLTEVDGFGAGPMGTLGLAAINQGRVALTRAGWRLAAAPSPLLDEADGITLSPPEAEILRAQLRQSPDEIAAVRGFLEIVRQCRGKQEQIDELLMDDHPGWSREFVVAQRSAMLGRLRDLATLEVTGRGPSATVHLLPTAAQLDAIPAQ